MKINYKKKLVSPGIDVLNVDFFTFTIHLSAFIVALVNSIINFSLNLFFSFYVDCFIMFAIVVAMVLYFVYKKYTLSTYISTFCISLGIAALLYLEGRVSFNFNYYFVLVFSIPFLLKSNKNFIKNNFTLFAIVTVIAVLSLTIAPVNPIYNHLNLQDSHLKMIINVSIGLITITIYSVIVVFTGNQYLNESVKEKEFSEMERDDRINALSSLGHELRTQVNSINGISQLISEQNKKETISYRKVNYYANLLDVCNDRMLNLVNDLLDTHKIESGKFQLNQKADNLFQILSKTADEYLVLANQKNIEFKNNIEPEISKLHLLFDADRIKQILSNFLSNAVKYTDKGFVTLSTSIVNDYSEHATILFEVRDTGIGIVESDHRRIFESFKQIKNDSSDIYGGAGLGLSLTKAILEKMDSEIKIESTINKGSTFSFRINFKKTSENTSSEDSIPIINSNIGLENHHILIVDDNKVIALYTDSLLKNHRANTFLAKDGIEAIEMVKTHSEIDTVLLDLEMPRLNGIEAIEQIKLLRPDLTVIAFTASSPDEHLIQDLSNYGFEDFITKPFRKETLINTICLTKSKTRQIKLPILDRKIS